MKTIQVKGLQESEVSATIKEFNKERNEALLSFDEVKIRAMVLKFNGHDMPTDPKLFWASVHKAITGCLQLPLAFRQAAKNWLSERGLKSLDDGDLK